MTINVERIPEPLNCAWCSRTARFIVNGNSACDHHYQVAYDWAVSTLARIGIDRYGDSIPQPNDVQRPQ